MERAMGIELTCEAWEIRNNNLKTLKLVALFCFRDGPADLEAKCRSWRSATYARMKSSALLRSGDRAPSQLRRSKLGVIGTKTKTASGKIWRDKNIGSPTEYVFVAGAKYDSRPLRAIRRQSYPSFISL
jgi:hypothetical protein